MPDNFFIRKRLTAIPKANYWRYSGLLSITIFIGFFISRILLVSGVFFKSPFYVYIIGWFLAAMFLWILSIYFNNIRSMVSLILIPSLILGSIISIEFLIDRFNNRSWVQSPQAIYQEQVLVDFFEKVTNLEYVNSENLSPQGDYSFTIFGDKKAIIYQTPSSSVSFREVIPINACLKFSVALAPEVWHIGMGDGVTFQIYISDVHQINHEEMIYSQLVDPKNNINQRSWIDGHVDLDKWEGHSVLIIFKTSPGPAQNDNYDWAGWGEPRMVTCQSIVH